MDRPSPSRLHLARPRRKRHPARLSLKGAAAESESVAAKPAPAAPPAVAANVPTPSSLGRPLTLKEKLAAARAGGAAQPGAAAAPPAPPVKAEAPAAAAAVEEPPAVEPARSRARAGQAAGPADDAPGKAGGRAGWCGAAPRHRPARPSRRPQSRLPRQRPRPRRPRPAAAREDDRPPRPRRGRPAGVRQEAKEQLAAKAAAAAPAKAKAPAKAAPAKPQTVPPKPTRELAARRSPVLETSRRGFDRRSSSPEIVAWIVVAWSTFTAAITAMTLMSVRFMFPNVLAEPPSTIKVGLPTNYEPEEVSERFKAEWGFWIVRSTRYNGQDIIYALQSVCTHLGCPPNWLASRAKIQMPVSWQRLLHLRDQFRGPRPSSPGAIQGRARRRRPDHGRQESEDSSKN